MRRRKTILPANTGESPNTVARLNAEFEIGWQQESDVRHAQLERVADERAGGLALLTVRRIGDNGIDARVGQRAELQEIAGRRDHLKAGGAQRIAHAVGWRRCRLPHMQGARRQIRDDGRRDMAWSFS